MRGSTWRVTGKSVLITGAAGGIGAAVARLLAARQAHLSLVDVGTAHLIYTATETARGAVEHPLMRGLSGLRMMKPQPVEATAALLVRLTLTCPNVFQLAVERLAHRHGWAAAIRKLEGTDGGRDASLGTSTRGDTKEQ